MFSYQRVKSWPCGGHQARGTTPRRQSFRVLWVILAQANLVVALWVVVFLCLSNLRGFTRAERLLLQNVVYLLNLHDACDDAGGRQFCARIYGKSKCAAF